MAPSRTLARLVLPALLLSAGAPARSAPSAPAGPVVNRLRPFATDGCSRFPDGIPVLEPTKWRRCCVAHDVAYWQGGTAEQRERADAALNACVAKTGAPAVGGAMYLGVRVGGFEGLPTTWHWGYGWVLDRGYAPLAPDEQEQVRERMKAVPADLDLLPIQSLPTIRRRDSLTGDHCLDLAVAEIRARLGRSFAIRALDEAVREKADGTWKTLSVATDGCAEPFRFTFQLLRPTACRDAMNELLARGRVRLMRTEAPASCDAESGPASAPAADAARRALDSAALPLP